MYQLIYAVAYRINFDEVIQDKEPITQLFEKLKERLEESLVTPMHTRFYFKDRDGEENEFTFWLAEFFTGRSPLILRVPYPQAPMCGLARMKVEDPYKIITPISFDRDNIAHATKWLRAFGSKFGFTGRFTNDDGLTQKNFWNIIDKELQINLNFE